MKAPRLQIFRGVYSDRWHWRLRARNGQIIATGGEGYTRKSDCLKAAGRVREAFTRAEIVCSTF